jgi:general stress protein YciG
MDPALQKRIAAEGGKASHANGHAHKWTVEEARAAGRKGGQISRRKSSNNTPSE